jgi:hypothetical protein
MMHFIRISLLLRRSGGCYAEIEWIWCLNIVMHDRDMMGGAHFIHGCRG